MKKKNVDKTSKFCSTDDRSSYVILSMFFSIF